MAKLVWDQTGERTYHTGIDQVALFLQNSDGTYADGVAFSGVTGITQSPEGGEANDFYADNMKYLTIMGKETFGGTIKAYTYPDEWAKCDGSEEPTPGLRIKAQTRKPFGLVWRSIIGNDTDGNDHGYMLHIVYNARIQPSSVDNNTVNDSVEPYEFSWDFKTTEVNVDIDGIKPTAYIEIDSTATGIREGVFATLCEKIYGGSSSAPTLPSIEEVYSILSGETPVEYEIALRKSSTTIVAGSTEKLGIASKKPSDAVVAWVSSDEAVATVGDDGTVTAVGAGSATITASVNSGAVSDSCAVTVTAAQQGEG